MCGRGQLQFSDSEGRQQIHTSCSYSSEPVCATDQALKHCHQQEGREVQPSFERSLPTRNYNVSKSNHVRKYTRALQRRAESLGMRLTQGRSFLCPYPYTVRWYSIQQQDTLRKASAFTEQTLMPCTKLYKVQCHRPSVWQKVEKRSQLSITVSAHA